MMESCHRNRRRLQSLAEERQGLSCLQQALRLKAELWPSGWAAAETPDTPEPEALGSPKRHLDCSE